MTFLSRIVTVYIDTLSRIVATHIDTLEDTVNTLLFWGVGGCFPFTIGHWCIFSGKQSLCADFYLQHSLDTFRLWKMVKSSNSAFLPCSPWHVSTLALHLNSPYGAVFISQRKSPPELGERGNPLLIFPKNLAWTGRNVLNPGQRDTFQNSWKQIQTDWSFQR